MARLLSSFLNPLAILWLLLLAAAGWRLYRRKPLRALGPAALAALIYAVGGTQLPATFLAQLERPYAASRPEALPPADAIVVLGGMAARSTNDVFGFHFDGEADRVIAGLELARQGKARALVLGGGPLGDMESAGGEGEALARWIETWGLSRVPVHRLGPCRDTHDEGVRLRALAQTQGWKRVVLVTSAAHMRRAAATVARQGLEVAPFACDFKGLATLQRRPFLGFAPGLDGFQQLEEYLHEVVGWWVYRWRGWI